MSPMRRWLGLAVIFSLVSGPVAAPPAQALSVNEVIDKVGGVLIKVGVDPDQIEAARYTLNEPKHAGIVYGHAAAQDYPFFALVGAAKAAKGKTLPGIGVFTRAKCEMPITAIDAVFAKADAYVDEGQGKADTNAVTGAASAYAADFAKAQTAAAKEEVVSQLNENIPYFGEIRTICSFAFDTNFKAEKNLIKVVGGAVTQVVSIVDAFRNGDYVSGVAQMIQLGASAEVACAMLDSAIDTSFLGRTLVLSDLAKGACKGFAGKVIDGAKGIINGGVGLIEAGVSTLWEGGKAGLCKVYSIVGSGCSKAPPPPDEATLFVKGTQNYCVPYGGVKGATFKSPDNFSFNCNDGTACMRRPGEVTRCMTAADRAANDAQRAQILQSDIAAKLPAWKQDFVARWQSLCPNAEGKCKGAVTLIAAGIEAKVKQNAAQTPTATYHLVANLSQRKGETEAMRAVEDARFRVLTPAWGARLDQLAQKQCADVRCKDEMKVLRETMVEAVLGQHKLYPQKPYAAMSALLASGDKAARDYITQSRIRMSKTPVNGRPAPNGPVQPTAPKPGQGIKL